MYNYEELKTVIARNNKVLELVKSNLSPVTMTQVCEMFEITFPALKYALERGDDLGVLSRGKVRKGKTGREIIEELPKRVPLLTEQDYAAQLRRVADQIDAAPIFGDV